MAHEYTFSECYELLNVDAKTFRRWLEKAGIDPDRQVSKIDNRIKYLTEDQLKQLATDHGRTLRPISAQPVETIPANAYKLLIERVDRLENSRTYLSQQGETHENRLDAIVTNLETTEGLIGTLTERLTALTDHITKLEEQLTQTCAELDTLKQAKSKRTTKAQPNLPADLVGWRTFSELHQIPTTTTQRAINTSKLTKVEGEWKNGRAIIRGALDTQGRTQFYELFHEHEGFVACPDCPHA